MTTKCAGMNCQSTDGTNHSPECRAEHAAAVAGGRFVKLPRGEDGARDEREAFEAWIRELEGHPFARQFANLMWRAWQARAAYPQSTVKGVGQAKPWWHALAVAADAVEKSSDVWQGFGIQDAKVCVEAYLSAKVEAAPVYQFQTLDGFWRDCSEAAYQYAQAHDSANVRIVRIEKDSK